MSPSSAGTTGPATSIDTFDSVDETAFEHKASLSRNASFDIETEELEDEMEWHMDFESTYTKEDVLTDKITVFPCATLFTLNRNYMNQVPPLASGILDNANIQFSITEGNVSWRLFPGSDFNAAIDSKRQPYQLELHLLKISLQIYLYPSLSQYSKSITLKIRDVEVYDRVPKSKFRKFFCYQTPDTNHPPRETDSDMIDITFEAVRVEKGDELRFKLKILPVELHIDQDLVVFLEKFFDPSSSSLSTESPKKAKTATSINDPSFFQYVEISPISIQVDYKPKHVDYSSIKHGELMQLINFIHLDEAKIFLNGIKITGVHGWHRLMKRLIAIWLPHVRSTQLPQMASGIAGVKTLANLGSGIADLVLLPIEQYQKDGKIFKGISRGTKSFLKATTKETVRIGSQLATGAQFLLEKAEKTNSRIAADQQQSADQPQAVPAKLLRPLIRFTGTIADALVKLSDTLDGNSSSSNSKYKF